MFKSLMDCVSSHQFCYRLSLTVLWIVLLHFVSDEMLKYIDFQKYSGTLVHDIAELCLLVWIVKAFSILLSSCQYFVWMKILLHWLFDARVIPLKSFLDCILEILTTLPRKAVSGALVSLLFWTWRRLPKPTMPSLRYPLTVSATWIYQLLTMRHRT